MSKLEHALNTEYIIYTPYIALKGELWFVCRVYFGEKLPCHNETALHMALTVASFTKEVNPRLAKRPLVFNGRLVNRGLTSLIKEATVASIISHSIWCRAEQLKSAPLKADGTKVGPMIANTYYHPRQQMLCSCTRTLWQYMKAYSGMMAHGIP